MKTGDSVWAPPFVPHSFASRGHHEECYILALTYGGRLTGDVQRELATLESQAASGMSLPLRDLGRACPELLNAAVQARMLTPAQLAQISSISSQRLADLQSGRSTPTFSEYQLLASALNISVRDLLPAHTNATDGAVVQTRRNALTWTYPDSTAPSYRVTSLISDPSHPDTTALEIELLQSRPDLATELSTTQHSYLYVLPGGTVSIIWIHENTAFHKELAEGDSLYLSPNLRFRLGNNGDTSGRLLMLRISCAVTQDVQFALGALKPEHWARYPTEDRMWYRPEGKRID
jgi:transcriptional regulator with XRE-family HTH domain/quercetin dioxygenase-like cupin family protein